MAHIITAVKGQEADLVTVRTALLSVSDKTGLVELGIALAARGVVVSRRARSIPQLQHACASHYDSALYKQSSSTDVIVCHLALLAQLAAMKNFDGAAAAQLTCTHHNCSSCQQAEPQSRCATLGSP